MDRIRCYERRDGGSIPSRGANIDTKSNNSYNQIIKYPGGRIGRVTTLRSWVKRIAGSSNLPQGTKYARVDELVESPR